MNIFAEDHQYILRNLIKADVDFMLIGGYAVIYYGYRRTTGDMDLWVKPSNDNKIRFVAALSACGFTEESLAQINALDFEKTLMFTVGEEPEKVDFLTHISGLKYEDAEKNKIIGDIDGMKVPVVHMNDLVLSKMSTDRPKDRADIEELQKIAKKNK